MSVQFREQLKFKMATGEISTLKEDMSKYTCSLCIERYGKQRRPKILPCFHTFCLPCLTLLENSAVAIATPDDRQKESQEAADGQAGQPTDTENDEMEKNTAVKPDSEGESCDVTNTEDDAATGRAGGHVKKAVFPCPTCRAPVPIPEGGVTFFQTNFYLEPDTPSDKELPPSLCNMCTVGSQQQATQVCQECSLRMCPDCRRQHDMCTRGHHVTPLTLGQPEQAGKENKTSFCSLHPEQRLHFCCRQCDVIICLICKVMTHEGHQTVDMATVEAECMAEIPTLLTTAQEQLQVVESSSRRAERDERDLSRHVRNLTQEIKGRCDAIIARVTQSRDELLEEMNEMEQRARSQLRAQKSPALITADTLSTLVTRAARAGRNDVISLRKELRAALLSEDMLDHHRQLTVRQESWSGWTYDVADVSTVPVTACMGRVVEVGACDVTKPLSLAELTDKLGRLENDVTQVTADITNTKTDLQADLTETKADLTNTKADLTNTKADLNNTKADLKADLTNSKADLTNTKADLTNTKADLTKTKADLTAALTETKADLTKTKADLTRTKADLTNTKADLTNTKADLTANLTKTKADLTNTKADLTKTKADLTAALTETKADLTAALTETKADLTKTKADLTNTKADLTKTKADFTADLTNPKADLTKTKANIDTINTNMKKQADKLAKAGRMVAFQVQNIEKAKTKKGQPIIFRKVKVNEGGCYDQTTGKFTAPVRGTYVFSAAVGKEPDQSGLVGACIVVNGEDHAGLFGSSTSTGGNSVSVQLGVGQTVWVKARSDVADYSHYDEMCFTGALVQPEL